MAKKQCFYRNIRSFVRLFFSQVRCVAGEQAIQAAVYNNEDTSRKRTRSVISTLSRTTSLSTTPVDTPVRAGDLSYNQSNVDCIPPIPIFDLLAADNDDSGNTPRGMTHLKALFLSSQKPTRKLAA